MPIQIDTDFPGGNIIIDRIEGNHAFIRQDLRDTEGDWFYWNFRVRPEGDSWNGQTLQFTFTGSDVLGALGPAVSEDGGISWRWLGVESISREPAATFQYTVPDRLKELRFAFCVPYTLEHWNHWFAALPQSAWSDGARLQPFSLGTTRGGRNFPALELIPEAPPLAKILLTARHHCCEAAASYALEGLLSAWCANDELGSWLRSHLHLTAIPFVDLDGVQAGDQGKNRRPHDHNRDYAGEIENAVYPEVAAIRRFVLDWLTSDSRCFALDMHCPWIRHGYNEQVYFVGTPSERVRPATLRFSQALEQVRTGPLPYAASNDLPFGQDWNVASTYKTEMANFSSRMHSFPQVEFAISLEVPYANAQGVQVTPATARALGRDLAAAFRQYLSA